jgi:Gpi18-like mannosyltransferase
MRFIKNHKLLLLLIAGLLLRLLISFQTYSGDVNNHISWGKDVLANGTQGIYGREFMPAYGTLTPTYPPIPIFLFTVSQALYDWTYNTSWYLNNTCKVFPSNFIFFLEDQDTLPAFHKLPAIFADIGLAFLTYLLVKKIVKKDNEKYGLFAASLVLFNPAFFYNSAYWGQIEAIPLFFLLCSLYLLFYKENYLLNAFTFSLALLTKQAVIIFIPVYALLFYMKFGLLKSVKGVLVNILTFLLLFFPFYDKGSVLYFPFSTYWNKIQTGSGSDYVVDHAFNFWSLTTGPGKIHDYLVPFLLSYRNWGYLIFFTLVVGVLC